jgi:hypothetical protein
VFIVLLGKKKENGRSLILLKEGGMDCKGMKSV